MKRAEVPVSFPCGADFSAMPDVEGGRLCATCKTVVRDLSSMRESEARSVLDAQATSRLCIRYLYDGAGSVVFAERDVAGAKIIPDHALTRRAKTRLLQTAMLAAPLVLFQACGGANGGGFSPDAQAEGVGGYQLADAGLTDAERDVIDAASGEGGDADAEQVGDGSTSDASDAADEGSSH